MPYYLLKILMTITLRLHFRRIDVSNLKVIENGKPTILLANHTNSFMDAMLLGILLKRRIHFFVRGDVFENRIADKILRSFGLMPVFRIQEGKDKLHQNEDSNKDALEILKKNGAVLIFAEGTSDVVKIARPFKKGPFRLAMQAAEILPELPQLIPVGINYLKPEEKQTIAWVNAGAPLHFPEDFKTDQPKKVLQLLRDADVAIKPLVLHAGTEEKSKIAEALLKAESEKDPDGLSFEKAKKITEDVKNDIAREGPAFKKRTGVKSLIGFILSLPVLIPVWLFHLLPLSLAGWITKRFVTSPDFTAAVYATTAAFLVLLWYILVFVLLCICIGWLKALLIIAFFAIYGSVFHAYFKRKIGVIFQNQNTT